MQCARGLHSSKNSQSSTAYAVAEATCPSSLPDDAESVGVDYDEDMTESFGQDTVDSESDMVGESFQPVHTPSVVEPHCRDKSLAAENEKVIARNTVAELEKNKESMATLTSMADDELQRVKSKFPNTSIDRLIENRGSLSIEPLLNFIQVHFNIDVNQKVVNEYLVKFLFRLFRQREDKIIQERSEVQVMPTVFMPTSVEDRCGQLEWPMDNTAETQDDLMTLARSMPSKLNVPGLTWHSQKVMKSSESVKGVKRTVQKDAMSSSSRCSGARIRTVSKEMTSDSNGSTAKAFASVRTVVPTERV